MSLCDRCRASAGCLLNYGGKACQNLRREVCPDVVFTHGDKIREMDDGELAVMFAKLGADLTRLDRPVQQYRGEDANACMEWLETPVEELGR